MPRTGKREEEGKLERGGGETKARTQLQIKINLRGKEEEQQRKTTGVFVYLICVPNTTTPLCRAQRHEGLHI